jgi:SAM-dependent methyltransferase
MTAHEIATRRFVDLGCGMGRPLYFFAHRFDELFGYELVAPIHARASAQLARAQATRADFRRISILCTDSTTAVPLDQPPVAFLYNPFGSKPMARLCARLRETRSHMHVYYANPVLMDMIAAAVGPPEDIFRCDFDIAYFQIRPH